MPAERIGMRDAREIIRLKSSSVSTHEIARRLGMGRTRNDGERRFRARAPRDSRQCRLPRTYQHTDDRGKLGRDQRTLHPVRPVGSHQRPPQAHAVLALMRGATRKAARGQS
jgi:hypothetical protein